MAAVLSDKTFMCALSKISDLAKVFKAKNIALSSSMLICNYCSSGGHAPLALLCLYEAMKHSNNAKHLSIFF